MLWIWNTHKYKKGTTRIFVTKFNFFISKPIQLSSRNNLLHRRYPRIPDPHFKNTKMKPVYNTHKKEQWESQPSDGKMVDCVQIKQLVLPSAGLFTNKINQVWWIKNIHKEDILIHWITSPPQNILMLYKYHNFIRILVFFNYFTIVFIIIGQIQYMFTASQVLDRPLNFTVKSGGLAVDSCLCKKITWNSAVLYSHYT